MKVFLERNKYEMFKHPREAQAAVRDKWILTAYKGNCVFLIFIKKSSPNKSF